MKYKLFFFSTLIIPLLAFSGDEASDCSTAIKKTNEQETESSYKYDADSVAAAVLEIDGLRNQPSTMRNLPYSFTARPLGEQALAELEHRMTQILELTDHFLSPAREEYSAKYSAFRFDYAGVPVAKKRAYIRFAKQILDQYQRGEINLHPERAVFYLKAAQPGLTSFCRASPTKTILSGAKDLVASCRSFDRRPSAMFSAS